MSTSKLPVFQVKIVPSDANNSGSYSYVKMASTTMAGEVIPDKVGAVVAAVIATETCNSVKSDMVVSTTLESNLSSLNVSTTPLSDSRSSNTSDVSNDAERPRSTVRHKLVRCCVHGCPANSRDFRHISFFPFPNGPRRLFWTKFTRRKSLQASNGEIKNQDELRICSAHFLFTDFANPQTRNKLNSMAAPSVFDVSTCPWFLNRDYDPKISLAESPNPIELSPRESFEQKHDSVNMEFTKDTPSLPQKDAHYPLSASIKTEPQVSDKVDCSDLCAYHRLLRRSTTCVGLELDAMKFCSMCGAAVKETLKVTSNVYQIACRRGHTQLLTEEFNERCDEWLLACQKRHRLRGFLDPPCHSPCHLCDDHYLPPRHDPPSDSHDLEQTTMLRSDDDKSSIRRSFHVTRARMPTTFPSIVRQAFKFPEYVCTADASCDCDISMDLPTDDNNEQPQVLVDLPPRLNKETQTQMVKFSRDTQTFFKQTKLCSKETQTNILGTVTCIDETQANARMRPLFARGAQSYFNKMEMCSKIVQTNINMTQLLNEESNIRSEMRLKEAQLLKKETGINNKETQMIAKDRGSTISLVLKQRQLIDSLQSRLESITRSTEDMRKQIVQPVTPQPLSDDDVIEKVLPTYLSGVSLKLVETQVRLSGRKLRRWPPFLLALGKVIYTESRTAYNVVRQLWNFPANDTIRRLPPVPNDIGTVKQYIHKTFDGVSLIKERPTLKRKKYDPEIDSMLRKEKLARTDRPNESFVDGDEQIPLGDLSFSDEAAIAADYLLNTEPPFATEEVTTSTLITEEVPTFIHGEPDNEQVVQTSPPDSVTAKITPAMTSSASITTASGPNSETTAPGGLMVDNGNIYFTETANDGSFVYHVIENGDEILRQLDSDPIFEQLQSMSKQEKVEKV